MNHISDGFSDILCDQHMGLYKVPIINSKTVALQKATNSILSCDNLLVVVKATFSQSDHNISCWFHSAHNRRLSDDFLAAVKQRDPITGTWSPISTEKKIEGLTARFLNRTSRSPVYSSGAVVHYEPN
jgi:hypothetical protein